MYLYHNFFKLTELLFLLGRNQGFLFEFLSLHQNMQTELTVQCIFCINKHAQDNSPQFLQFTLRMF